MTYDVIIIGAGLGGLSAGLSLVEKGKKVLILEKNSLPGGSITTIKKGRFEFDTGFYEFYGYGNKEKVGTIKKILEEYGIDLETILIPMNIKIKTKDKEEFSIQGDINDFFVELEKLKPGSIDSLKELLKVVKEIHEGYEALKNGKEDLSEEYPNFIKYLNANVIDALKDLKVPKETIHRLGYLWIYFNSPLEKLSFIDFAELLYQIAFKKINILKKKNIHMLLEMAQNFQDKKGKIYYRSKVIDVTDKGEEKVVTTADKKEYIANEVICDVSKRYVYQDLIKEDKSKENKIENARTLGPNEITVYLGLNKNHKELNLDYYHYYSFQNMNSSINIKTMNNWGHETFEAIVPNVANENASPKNTTILILKALYFDDAFRNITKSSIKSLTEKISKNLIEQFESTFSIDIKEYIEEVVCTSPLDVAQYTNRPNGSKGYMPKGYDNAIHRLISYPKERIPGLSFVGSSSLFGAKEHNEIYSGYYIGKKISKQEEKKDGK